MARIRTIKPIHWSDKELPKISLQAHLLWIAVWNFSDDDGVFEGDPLLLKSQIFPRRTDIRVEQISQWLDQLVKARFIIPFHYKGEGYYISRTFKTHQRIDKPQPGIIPFEELCKAFPEHSTNVPGIVLPVLESTGEESKGDEGAKAPVDPEPEQKPVLPEKPQPEQPEPPQKPDLKADYRLLLEPLKGKKPGEVYPAVRQFIVESRPDFIEPYVELWNMFAGKYHLSQVAVVNTDRRKKFAVRILEPDFDFMQILDEIRQSSHLKGDSSGTSTWKVNFDWILENSKNYVKIIEGQYK